MFLGVALALSLVEVSARTMEQHFEARSGWANQRSADVANALRHVDPAIDVVFVGNSQAYYAIDPTQFTASTGQPSFNAGVPGATTEHHETWIFDIIASYLDVQTYVITVSPMDLQDEFEPRYSRAALLASPGYASLQDDRWRAQGELWLNDHSALIRNRQSLRDPNTMAGALERTFQGQRNWFSVGTDAVGGINTFPPIEEISPARTASMIEDYACCGYTTGGSRTATLSDIISRLQADAREVVVVSMPMHPDGLALLPDGCANVDDYHQALADVAAETGVAIFNGESVVSGDADYFDPIHMTRSGRSKFTAWLSDRLTAPPAPSTASVRDLPCAWSAERTR